MKYIVTIFALFFSSRVLSQSCIYGISTCKTNEACIKIDNQSAQCILHPDHIPSIVFPMKAPAGIYCDQGNLSLDGNSHTYTNTAFALDLVSNRNFRAGEVIAGSEGVVISYSECKTQNDQCGNGFGNYVQILRDDGYLLFYAHLDKVLVQTGDKVKIGNLIGIEGNTGWTGENNRHLHFSVHYNWKNLGFNTLKNNIGWLPNSTPFKLNACQPNQQNCNLLNTDSRDFKCSRVTNSLDWIKTL